MSCQAVARALRSPSRASWPVESFWSAMISAAASTVFLSFGSRRAAFFWMNLVWAAIAAIFCGHSVGLDCASCPAIILLSDSMAAQASPIVSILGPHRGSMEGAGAPCRSSGRSDKEVSAAREKGEG